MSKPDMNTHSLDIGVVIPVFNENESLQELYTRLSTVLDSMSVSYELLFVDDGSATDFKQKLRDLAKLDAKVRTLFLSRNFGKEAALSAGLAHVQGDCVVVIDGDLQDPPELIPEMYAAFLSGNEAVTMQRKSRRGETLLKRFTAYLFYRLLNKISPVEIPVDTGDFRLIGRKTVNAINAMPENNRYMKGLFAWVGMTTHVIEFEREVRHSGKTKWSFFKLLGLSMEAITSFSISPLRIATVIGFIATLLGAIFGAWIIFEKIVLGNPVSGYPSIIVLIVLFGGVQLLTIGLLGEYIGKMYLETKRRPIFLVEEDNLNTAKPVTRVKKKVAKDKSAAS